MNVAEISEFDKSYIGKILNSLKSEPCWWTADLIRLIAKADKPNRLLLSQVYPEHVKAVEEYLK